jgi:predicted ATPase
VQRLVTLAGPPGSGKTRLAVELGRLALGTFADGAWFVPLAPIQDDGLVGHAVAGRSTFRRSRAPRCPRSWRSTWGRAGCS